MGGHTVDPTYDDICTGTTGHAEVVEVLYNTKELSTRMLLEAFFKMHNPTTLNRQGYDIGTQYRSAIFYINEIQKNIAEEIMSSIKDQYDVPIVTELKKASQFYKEENYHQNFYNSNPTHPYCQYVILPKLKY
jgi:peptide-methionine (S)-S-oxide reductase